MTTHMRTLFALLGVMGCTGSDPAPAPSASPEPTSAPAAAPAPAAAAWRAVIAVRPAEGAAPKAMDQQQALETSLADLRVWTTAVSAADGTVSVPASDGGTGGIVSLAPAAVAGGAWVFAGEDHPAEVFALDDPRLGAGTIDDVAAAARDWFDTPAWRAIVAFRRATSTEAFDGYAPALTAQAAAHGIVVVEASGGVVPIEVAGVQVGQVDIDAETDMAAGWVFAEPGRPTQYQPQAGLREVLTNAGGYFDLELKPARPGRGEGRGGRMAEGEGKAGKAGRSGAEEGKAGKGFKAGKGGARNRNDGGGE